MEHNSLNQYSSMVHCDSNWVGIRVREGGKEIGREQISLPVRLLDWSVVIDHNLSAMHLAWSPIIRQGHLLYVLRTSIADYHALSSILPIPRGKHPAIASSPQCHKKKSGFS